MNRITLGSRWSELPVGWRWVGWGIGGGALLVPLLLRLVDGGMITVSILARDLAVGLPGAVIWGLLVALPGHRRAILGNLLALAGIAVILLPGIGPHLAAWCAIALLLQIPGKTRVAVGAILLALPIYWTERWQPVLWEGEEVSIRARYELTVRPSNRGGIRIARTPDELQGMWKEDWERYGELPKIDFRGSMVIVCEMGWSGVKRHFDRVEVRKVGRVLRVVRVIRAPLEPWHADLACFTTKVYALVVDASDLPVTTLPQVIVH